MAKILVIEDESAIRRVLVKILTEESDTYQVVEAENGEIGIEIFEKQDFDLVLCDIKMPKMGGVEVLERAKRSKPLIPFIMLSGHGNLDTAVKTMRLGAYDYISKPPDLNRFLSSITEALEDKFTFKEQQNTVHQTENSKVKVLLIEDEVATRRVLVNLLRKENDIYEVSEAEDGLKGIEIFERQDFDLVLCDIKMPKMNGLEVLERAKKIKPQVPFIMVSGHGDLDVAVNTMRLGAYDYISKPPDLNRLFNTIKNAVGDRNQENNEIGQEQSLIAVAYIDGKLRCIRISRDGDYALVDKKNYYHNILYPNFLHVIQLKQAVEEFEYLINNPKTREQDLQVFFEKNPEFILNDDYRVAHSKIILSNKNNVNLIPDFILEPYDNKHMSDLLELKLPKTKVYTLKKNRYRYSSAVFEACAQLREYSTYFEEEFNRKRILGRHGLHLYKPNMLVIIGRQSNLDPVQIKKIHNDLSNLKLISYDEVLNKMKRKLK